MIGTHLGERYELTLLLHESPIFSSYFARDKVLGRDVTVRVIKPPFSAEPHFLMKLREVIKHAGSVQNEGVERLLDLVDEPSLAYLVSDFSKGAILSERIRKLAPYSVAASVSMVVSILSGLEAIHNSGFVHGDPGAHNIIVQDDGACRLELPGLWEAYSSSETAGVVMLPSMAPYIAPEVSAGGMPTPSSDVYAVGVILYQLLTGRFPYVGETAVATAMKHTSTPTPSARTANTAVPAALDDLVKRAMAKEPSVRYRSATQMLDDLKRIESTVRFGKAAAPAPRQPQPSYVDPVPAPAPTGAAASVTAPKPAPRAPRPIPEEREPRDVPLWLVVISTFVLTVVVVMVGGWYWFSSSAPKPLKVPPIVGQPKSDAQNSLTSLNLQMQVSKSEVNEKYPLDTVISASPAPGQEVKQGGIVVVVLSAGSRLVTVPDLRGKTTDQAKEILSGLSLDLDRVDPVPDSKLAAGLIVRQSPDPKTRVERSTRVNVGISAPIQQPAPAVQTPSNAPAPIPTVNPNSRYLYTIKIRLTKITEPVVLRVDITDANGTRKIYEAQHFPNEEVSIRTEGYGEHAVFRIYYNGEFVTQVSKQADEGSAATGGSGGNGDNGDNSGDNTTGDNGAGQ